MAGVFRSLESSDISITPFQAYKEWKDLSDFTIYTASYGNRSSFDGGPFVDTFDLGNPGISQETTEPLTHNGLYQRVVHDSLNHLFYDDYYKNPYGVMSNPFIGFQTRDLRQKAKIISISQQKVGEGILKQSVQFTITGSQGSKALYDDLYGNLYLTDLDNYTSSLIDGDSILAQIQFYDLYQFKDQPSISYEKNYYKSDYKYIINHSNVVVTESLYLSSNPTPFYTASLSSSTEISYYVNPNFTEYLNFKNVDFGISLMVYATASNTATTSSILTKNGKYKFYAPNSDGTSELRVNLDRTHYPYQILMMSSSNGFNIQVDRSNYNNTTTVTSSAITPNTWNHILYTKSGSYVKLYINGLLQQTGSDITDNINNTPHNKSNLYVGSLGGSDYFFTGCVNELLFIERTPTTNEISTLSALSGSNTTRVGNVFYEHGMVTITDPRYVDYDLQAARVRGTQTIYEYQISCTSPAGEHNITFNPSILTYDTITKQKKVKDTYTASYFNPYVTTIGLYNDDGELLIVGKLPNPVQKLDNLDMTYILKFDR
jgi:hypothetical protein